MKKKFVFIICLVMLCGLAMAQSAGKEKLSEITPDLNLINRHLRSDFSMKHLSYENEGELIKMTAALSLEDKIELFNKNKKTYSKYMGMNAILPWIGSFMQKDFYGGVISVVEITVGGTLIQCGMTIAAYTELLYFWTVILGPFSGEFYDRTFLSPMYNLAIGFAAAGVVCIVGTYIAAINRPRAVAGAYNSALARVLGVTRADFALAPSLNSEYKPSGVTMALSLKI